MHQNFYHWHTKASVTPPDPSMLEARWAAAEKFVVKITAEDIHDLLRLVFFPHRESAFNTRFSDDLVKAEPSFTAEHNGNLLRVMAAASLSKKLESYSPAGVAISLGICAAEFPPGRTEAILGELVWQGKNYYPQAAEYYRPAIALEKLAAAEKRIETSLTGLKEAFAAGDAAKSSTTVDAFGKGLVTTLKESHGHIARVIGRLAEEGQVLWWVMGKRSTELKARREEITPLKYALASAHELISRTIPPPPASAEDLLIEVLSHCRSGGKKDAALAEAISSTPIEFLEKVATQPVARDLTPVMTLVWEAKNKTQLTPEIFKSVGLDSKQRFKAIDIAIQYFRELAFTRAIQEVK